jgi:carbon storage regulator
MLVLTRKCQEVVVVGGANGFEPLLKITVLGIVNGHVRLGFEAAADIPVHRMEVWERIRAGIPADSPTRDSDGHDWASNQP